MRAPLSAFLSTSFLPYKCIVQHSVKSTKNPASAAGAGVRGEFVFWDSETPRPPAPTALSEQQIHEKYERARSLHCGGRLLITHSRYHHNDQVVVNPARQFGSGSV